MDTLDLKASKFDVSKVNFIFFVGLFYLKSLMQQASWEPGLGSRSQVFLAPWSRSRSRLKKKPGAGAGATKKLVGSSALREDKTHR